MILTMDLEEASKRNDDHPYPIFISEFKYFLKIVVKELYEVKAKVFIFM